jgi:hypothetical protein
MKLKVIHYQIGTICPDHYRDYQIIKLINDDGRDRRLCQEA